MVAPYGRSTYATALEDGTIRPMTSRVLDAAPIKIFPRRHAYSSQYAAVPLFCVIFTRESLSDDGLWFLAEESLRGKAP